MGRAHPGCQHPQLIVLSCINPFIYAACVNSEPELPDLTNGCQDPIKVEGFWHTAGLGMSTLDAIETMTPALVRSSQSGRADEMPLHLVHSGAALLSTSLQEHRLAKEINPLSCNHTTISL